MICSRKNQSVCCGAACRKEINAHVAGRKDGARFDHHENGSSI